MEQNNLTIHNNPVDADLLETPRAYTPNYDDDDDDDWDDDDDDDD